MLALADLFVINRPHTQNLNSARTLSGSESPGEKLGRAQYVSDDFKARKAARKAAEVAVEAAKRKEAKPQEAKLQEAKPQEAKPKEAKPQEAKPKEAKPKEAKPKQAKQDVSDDPDDDEDVEDSKAKGGFFVSGVVDDLIAKGLSVQLMHAFSMPLSGWTEIGFRHTHAGKMSDQESQLVFGLPQDEVVKIMHAFEGMPTA